MLPDFPASAPSWSRRGQAIREAVRLVWTADASSFTILVALTLLRAYHPLALIYFNAQILGVLAESVAGVDSELLLPRMFTWLAWLAVVAVGGQIVQKCADHIQKLMQTRVARFAQRLVAEKASGLDLSSFENPEFHNEVLRASSNALFRPMAIVLQLTQCLAGCATLAGCTVVIYHWNPLLLPLLALMPAIQLAIGLRYAADTVRCQEERTENDRKASYYLALLTTEHAAKEIRLFNLRDLFLGRLQSLWLAEYQGEKNISWRNLRRHLLTAVLFLDRPLFLLFAATRLLAKKISFADFALFTQAMFAFQDACAALLNGLGQLFEHQLFLLTFSRFRERRAEVENRTSSEAAKGISAHPTIEFRHVYFRYPGTTRDILRDVNFVLRPGEILSLIGRNGSGKTTLIKLMTGLYEPTAGEVLFDGIDARQVSRAKIRACLGTVFQDFQIYHLPLRDNIGLGRVEEIDDERRIAAAGALSGMQPVVDLLPHGYDTLLGRHLSRGYDLSGGERQLLALTRMFFRDAAILVLDEPTAALDVFREKELLGKVVGEQRARNRSVVIITHRVSIAQATDRILILDDGSIVESGTHAELLARNALYAAMLRAGGDVLGANAPD